MARRAPQGIGGANGARGGKGNVDGNGGTGEDGRRILNGKAAQEGTKERPNQKGMTERRGGRHSREEDRRGRVG